MDNKANGIEKNHAFYKWDGAKAELLPLAKTWRILSKDMGLGKGTSKIYNASFDVGSKKEDVILDLKPPTISNFSPVISPQQSDLNMIGFRNVDGQYGAAIVNASPEARMVEVDLNNTGIKNYAKVQVYYATAGNDAKVPVYAGLMKVKDGTIKFPFYIPEESVVGMTFAEDKEWFDELHL